MLPSATNRTEKHRRFEARWAQAPILAPELKPALYEFCEVERSDEENQNMKDLNISLLFYPKKLMIASGSKFRTTAPRLADVDRV
jgi:hypothetical protein